MKPILAKTKVKQVIILDEAFAVDNSIPRLSSLVNQLSVTADELEALKKQASGISAKELFTLIYTSGTTGKPKGVMLSHENMVYQLEVMPQALGIDSSDRLLSILPVWHIFERVLEYVTIDSGANMYYSNIKDLKDDFVRDKPTFMGSAPRMWENIYHSLRERVDKTDGLNRFLFNTAYDIKRELHRSMNAVQGLELSQPGSIFERAIRTVTSAARAATLYLPDKYLDPIFLARVRNIIGGELKGTISGGGALPAHIDEFFNAIGIPVYEGYGMTECSPLIAMRHKGKVIEGSVGFIPPETRVKILNDKGQPVPDGEQGVIYVKGPGVMQGYYKDEVNTKRVLDQGWLNTGDIGFIGPAGTLSIRGRAKDTIVLLGGENVEPIPIEMLLTENKMIEQAVVTGQDKKHLTVLIWPNYDQLLDAGFDVHEFDATEDLNQNLEVVKLFRDIISDLISEKNGFKAFERIGGFRFIPDRLRVGTELTNLNKIKRNVVHQKYSLLIDSMYHEREHKAMF